LGFKWIVENDKELETFLKDLMSGGFENGAEAVVAAAAEAAKKIIHRSYLHSGYPIKESTMATYAFPAFRYGKKHWTGGKSLVRSGALANSVDISRRKSFAVKVVVYNDEARVRKNVRSRLNLFFALDIQFRRVGNPKENGMLILHFPCV